MTNIDVTSIAAPTLSTVTQITAIPSRPPVVAPVGIIAVLPSDGITPVTIRRWNGTTWTVLNEAS
jgi:hypothetical protein